MADRVGNGYMAVRVEHEHKVSHIHTVSMYIQQKLDKLNKWFCSRLLMKCVQYLDECVLYLSTFHHLLSLTIW